MSVNPSTWPAAPADGSAPLAPAYHPHPADYNPRHCAARDTSDELQHQDRRWTPFVYIAFQCKNLPVTTQAGTDLCAKCTRHAAKYARATTASEQRHSAWHGRVNEGLDTLPAVSHMAGSAWFKAKPKWTGEPKAQTEMQARHGDTRQLVKDVDLAHFAHGELELDIERLAAGNQITGQQLRDVWCMLTGRVTGAKSAGKFDTKAKLCTEIRRLRGDGAEGPTIYIRAADGTWKKPDVVDLPAAAAAAGAVPAIEVHEPVVLLMPPALDPLAVMAAQLAAAMERIATLEAAAAARREMLAHLAAL